MAVADNKLNRLFDNELPVDEADALRLELSEEDNAKLAALAELSSSVRDAIESEAATHEVDLWSTLQRQLPAQAPAKIVTLRRKWLVRTTAGVSAFAVAASLFFALRTGTVRDSGCEVEELEVVGSGATVMKVADDRGNDTTLIWFDHQEEDEWESL